MNKSLPDDWFEDKHDDQRALIAQFISGRLQFSNVSISMRNSYNEFIKILHGRFN